MAIAEETIKGIDEASEAMDRAFARLEALRDGSGDQVRLRRALHAKLYPKLDALNTWARGRRAEVLHWFAEHPGEDEEYEARLTALFNGMRERMWELAAIPELGEAAERMGQPTQPDVTA